MKYRRVRTCKYPVYDPYRCIGYEFEGVPCMFLNMIREVGTSRVHDLKYLEVVKEVEDRRENSMMFYHLYRMGA